MLNLITILFLVRTVSSQLEILNQALHPSMGPKFAITYESIESDICSFFKQITGVDSRIQCQVVGEEQSDEHGRVIKLTQSIEGIPIECADIRININKRGGRISINGEYFLHPPQLNALFLETEAARDRTRDILKEQEHKTLGIEYHDQKVQIDIPELRIVCPRPIHSGILRLGYRTRVKHLQNGKSGHLFIDAETGHHLKTHSRVFQVAGTTQTGYYGSQSVDVLLEGGTYYSEQTTPRNLLAADCTSVVDGFCPILSSLDKDQFGTSGDDKLMAAYWGAQRVIDLFKTEYGRSSFDGNGSKIQIFGITQVNAYWVQDNGIGNAYFGFRDDINLSSLEVVCHQITHGIIEATADLVYQDQPGAVNEAIADIFGVYCYQKILNRPDVWEVGTESTHLTRSFRDPKAHFQPDFVKGTNWYSGSEDNGGVHTNSGPLNYAFYLMSVGGSGTNENGESYEVSGIGIQKSMNIVYRALTNYLTQNSMYAETSSALSQAAISLYGANSQEQNAVKNAMLAIGVGIQSQFPETPTEEETENGAEYMATLSSFLMIFVILLILN